MNTTTRQLRTRLFTMRLSAREERRFQRLAKRMHLSVAQMFRRLVDEAWERTLLR